MPNGDAMSYLRKSTSPEDRQLKALKLLHGLACAMKYLHDMYIIHADLKPPQVLVDKDGECRLTDFGFAKILEHTAAQERVDFSAPGENARNARLADVRESAYQGGRVGTSWYMSPNRLDRMHTTKEDDVYSYGISIYEMWTGIEARDAYWQLLQDRWDERWYEIYSGLRPELPSDSGMPESLEALMKECWHSDPAVRPTFAQIELRVKEILDGHSSNNGSNVYSATDTQKSPLSTLSRDEISRALQPNMIPRAPDGTVDIDQARLVYQQAAELGFADAQERLAFFYRYG
ncbi:hypothetical protein HDU93_004425, partial [Gonapodya sp. JEL0774]